jgi:hypothetical protein
LKDRDVVEVACRSVVTRASSTLPFFGELRRMPP